MKYAFYIVFVLCAFIKTDAFAADSRDTDVKVVGNFVKDTATKVANILNSRVAPEEQIRRLTDVFYSAVDYEWMAKFVVAQFWNQMKQDQQKTYLAAYKSTLSRSYVKHFKEYDGQRFDVKSINEISEKQYLVIVTIVSKNGDAQPLDIAYRLKLYPNNAVKIIDIVAENVSLLATQRADFASVISNDGINGFIAKLQKM